MELNKVLLIGNLTRDPESRALQSGSQVVKMGMAVNRRQKDGQDDVLFVDVEAWNKTAELCVQYLRKGSQVLVEGRLKLDQYTTREGEKRQRLFVVADRVQFGAKPRDESGDQPPPAYRAPSRRADLAQPSPDLPFEDLGLNPDSDDNLPF